jgi:hypothetical protein
VRQYNPELLPPQTAADCLSVREVLEEQGDPDRAALRSPDHTIKPRTSIATKSAPIAKFPRVSTAINRLAPPPSLDLIAQSFDLGQLREYHFCSHEFASRRLFASEGNLSSGPRAFTHPHRKDTIFADRRDLRLKGKMRPRA